MGCIFSKQHSLTPTPERKIYSWELRRAAGGNAKEFQIEDIKNDEVIRLPGSVNGQQFLIQNCYDATIMVFDLADSVTVDDCHNCTIILAAVKGSVYLRNCTKVTCITSCGQFRTRDCRKCQIFIHCATQPIIESSTGIKFGLFGLSYKNIENHLFEAGLNINITSWTEVYDFTPVPNETNWAFIDASKAKFTLKARSKRVENILKELNVTWLGKEPVSLAIETTV